MTQNCYLSLHESIDIREKEKKKEKDTRTDIYRQLVSIIMQNERKKTAMNQHIIVIQSFWKHILVNCIITSITEVFVLKGCFDFRRKQRRKKKY